MEISLIIYIIIACTLILCVISLNFLNKKKILNADIASLKKEIYLLKDESTKDKQYIETQRQNFSNTVDQLKQNLKEETVFIQKREVELKQEEEKLQEQIKALQENLDKESENRKKILSQKKSSEVRLGHIAETLAPFLDQFDFDPETCTFLGKPIDYVSFGDEEITFIEVKSGNSQLNSRQRHIRDLVKNKCIAWKEIRIK